MDALRAWFFFHGKPTDQGATIEDVTTDEEQGDTMSEPQQPQSEPQSTEKRDSGTRIHFNPEDVPDFEEAA